MSNTAMDKVISTFKAAIYQIVEGFSPYSRARIHTDLDMVPEEVYDLLLDARRKYGLSFSYQMAYLAAEDLYIHAFVIYPEIINEDL